MTAVKYYDAQAQQWKTLGVVQGPPGPPGANGTVAIYTQATDPGVVANGSLWIDTDEAPAIAVMSQIVQAYTITAGYTKDRAFNPQATSIGEVAAALATLIDDLRAAGIIRP